LKVFKTEDKDKEAAAAKKAERPVQNFYGTTAKWFKVRMYAYN
jgi:hypothetical protein